jgi:hypothetical protein
MRLASMTTDTCNRKLLPESEKPRLVAGVFAICMHRVTYGKPNLDLYS